MRSVCSMGAKDKMRHIEAHMAEAGGAIPFSAASLLADDETILYETRRHWATMLPYLAAALLFGRFTSGLSLFLLLLPFFQIKTFDYTVTDRRIVVREGMLRPVHRSIPLTDISAVAPSVGPLGPLLGLGDVTIETSEGTSVLRKIEDPAAFAFYAKQACAGCQVAAQRIESAVP